METKRLIATLGAALVVAAGCAREPTVATTPQTVQPDAASLWNYITAENYRNNWVYWPGKGKLYPGIEPHGAYLTTYLNPLARDAVTNGASHMPHGAIFVKENYTPRKTLAAITIMYKAPAGYNPQHNDWFFMKRLADGTVEASGQVDSCQKCHSTSDRDYLMTGQRKK